MGNLGVGNYTVSVTDNNGCSTTTSFSIIATDNQPPLIICPNNILRCGTGVVNYPNATAQDNCGIPNQPSVISGPASGSVFQEGITVIVFRASDGNNNSSTCSFSVIVNALPNVSVDAVVNDMNGQGVGVISITPSGNGGFQFAWSKNGQPFATTEDLTGLSAGVYTLVITDSNGCTFSPPAITISNSVGTAEPGEGGSVRLWPNPSNAAIQLEIIDLDVIAASIVDLRGRLVQRIPVAELSSEIEIGELPEGVYCLKLGTAKGRVLSLKFVKVN